MRNYDYGWLYKGTQMMSVAMKNKFHKNNADVN